MPRTGGTRLVQCPICNEHVHHLLLDGHLESGRCAAPRQMPSALCPPAVAAVADAAAAQIPTEAADAVVNCPLCGLQLRNADAFAHLELCSGGRGSNGPSGSGPSSCGSAHASEPRRGSRGLGVGGGGSRESSGERSEEREGGDGGAAGERRPAQGCPCNDGRRGSSTGGSGSGDSCASSRTGIGGRSAKGRDAPVIATDAASSASVRCPACDALCTSVEDLNDHLDSGCTDRTAHAREPPADGCGATVVAPPAAAAPAAPRAAALDTSRLDRLAQEMRCSLCLDLYDNPHSLPCNHSFCLECLTSCFKATSTMACPLCKAPMWRRQVTPNHTLAGIVAAFRELKRGQPSADQEAASPGAALAARDGDHGGGPERCGGSPCF